MVELLRFIHCSDVLWASWSRESQSSWLFVQWQHDCLFNWMLRLTTKKHKISIAGAFWGNSTGHFGFLSQWANDAQAFPHQTVSICHKGFRHCLGIYVSIHIARGMFLKSSDKIWLLLSYGGMNIYMYGGSNFITMGWYHKTNLPYNHLKWKYSKTPVVYSYCPVEMLH